MASAWGSAWGRAWGNSWGKIQAIIAGGIGSGGGRGGKKKPVYIKRQDQILLFPDGDSAKAWIEAEQAIERARERGKPYRPRKPKPLDAKPWQALEIPRIADLASRFKEQEAFTRHLAAENWEALAVIYDHLRQREEEEILAVLLAA